MHAELEIYRQPSQEDNKDAAPVRLIHSGVAVFASTRASSFSRKDYPYRHVGTDKKRGPVGYGWTTAEFR